MTALLSLNQAARVGVRHLRMEKWAGPLDHIRIDIVDGSLGPWIRLFSPQNEAINGRDPVEMIGALMPGYRPDAPAYVAYTGPLADSEEYRRQSTEFAEHVHRLKGAAA